MPAPNAQPIKAGVMTRLDTSTFKASHPVLVQFVNTLSQDIAIAWTLWSTGLLTAPNDVEGSGIGTWSGIGKGGKLTETIPFQIIHTWPQANDEWLSLKDAITSEFKATFGKYASSFTQLNVQYSGSCSALPPMPPVLPAGAPGPISATAIPSTIILIKSPSPSFKGLGERIHNRLPPKWLQYKHPLQEFLKALEDTVIEQHSLWEVSSMVVGDTFTATGAAITGSGSGKSLGTGKII